MSWRGAVTLSGVAELLRGARIGEIGPIVGGWQLALSTDSDVGLGPLPLDDDGPPTGAPPLPRTPLWHAAHARSRA